MKILLLTALVFFAGHLEVNASDMPSEDVYTCNFLQSQLVIMYETAIEHVGSKDYGISEICDYAMKSGSENMQKTCIDFDNMGCVE